MTEQDVGPIDYLVVEFPGGNLKGEAFGALIDLVEAGTIRILDLAVAMVGENGDFTAVEITDLDGDGTLDLAVFEGVSSGLLDEDDLAQSASLVEAGNGIAMLVYENTWAGPFVSALRHIGADVIASGRIPADEVIAALDALEASDA
jgi:hypothetical protein